MKKAEAKQFTEKHLLEEGFAKPTVLVTYDGNVLIKEKIEVFKYDHKIDGQKSTPKLIVLFAFPFGDYDAINTGINLNQKIAAQDLKPIKNRSKRPVVATAEEYQTGNGQPVNITMRSGHILSGYQTYTTEYNLLLKINDVEVLVYKHGILAYRVGARG